MAKSNRSTRQPATERHLPLQAQAEALIRLQRDLAIALTSPGTLRETLTRVLDAGCQVEGVDCGGIYLVDAERQQMDLVCHRGLSKTFVAKAAHYSPRTRQMRLVMAGRALYLSRDYIVTSGSPAVKERLRSIAVVPVKHANRVVAVLNLASHAAAEIVPHARNAIEAIAAQIGPTIARVRAEAAVLANERNFQSLFGTLEDFLFIADARGCLLHVNPVAERRLGYSAADLKGRPISVVHPPALRRRAEAIVKAMLAGKSDLCDIPLRTRGGTLIPVETRVVRGEWNGAPALFGISRDITERMRSEQQLLERQRQLHALVSQLGVAEETERRRIAYGLHDDMGQVLALCKMNLDRLATQVDGKENRTTVVEIGRYVDRLLKTSRALTFDLASPVLQRFGLQAAVEDLCDKMSEQHGIPFVPRGNRSPVQLPNAMEIIVFHAVRELMRNIVRHARAQQAVVTLSRSSANLIVSVEDDGVGCDESLQLNPDHDSFGLHAIRERMNYLGGSFAMGPVKPHGTRVTLTVPLTPGRPA